MIADEVSVSVQVPGFAERLGSACETFLSLWHGTPCHPPTLGPKIGLWQQRSNAHATARLIDEVAADIETLPAEESARQAWRQHMRERLQTFGRERLGWPEGYRRLVFGDAFYESSIVFARQARAFDPSVTLEQLGQALRNVWIGNSLQMLLDRPVTMGPGLFAYSMLYPVTDNWLDNPDITPDLKRAFNERLGKRLAGFHVHAIDEREAAVDHLVTQIEADLPRDRFPDVYTSLLAIHRGQSRSLDQQGGTGLTDSDLLGISFEKGGSSVLADLYLVAGAPEPWEELFAFGYGVFLQLLDDLQDVETDLAMGHETLFTRAARRGLLDRLTARLVHFIDEVLASQERFQHPEFEDRVDLIRRNCRVLLVGSVSEHPQRFSRQFRQHLARQWPLSFRACRRLRRHALKRWNKAAIRLRARGELPF